MKYTWLIYMNGDKRLAPIAVEYIKFIKTLKLRGVDIVLLCTLDNETTLIINNKEEQIKPAGKMTHVNTLEWFITTYTSDSKSRSVILQLWGHGYSVYYKYLLSSGATNSQLDLKAIAPIIAAGIDVLVIDTCLGQGVELLAQYALCLPEPRLKYICGSASFLDWNGCNIKKAFKLFRALDATLPNLVKSIVHSSDDKSSISAYRVNPPVVRDLCANLRAIFKILKRDVNGERLSAVLDSSVQISEDSIYDLSSFIDVLQNLFLVKDYKGLAQYCGNAMANLGALCLAKHGYGKYADTYNIHITLWTKMARKKKAAAANLRYYKTLIFDQLTDSTSLLSTLSTESPTSRQHIKTVVSKVKRGWRGGRAPAPAPCA